LAASPLESILKRDRIVVAAALAALFLVAWAFLIHLAGGMARMEGLSARMMGMSVNDRVSAALEAAMSPGAAALADAGVNFLLLALMWAIMMVAMMIPGAAPTILLFSALERKRASATGMGGRTAAFVAGYVAIWCAFSIVAAALQTALSHGGLLSMQMTMRSALLAGVVFIAAGIYEFTPLKDRCLTHCRSPLEWLPQHMRPGRSGAFRMGVEHGTYCVGCCWVLMLLLFAVGIMNLVWVAALAAIVLVQKLLPAGILPQRLVGGLLVAVGLVAIARPMLL
jgi:predicted metal-binding membrane protein